MGYSGDNQAGAFAARLSDVAVVQTSINICDQVNIDEVLPVACEREVGVMAKRPIANAAWKDLNDQPGFYARYAETYTERLALMAIEPEEIGFEESDWAEVALRFTLSCDIGTAIIGTTNPDHVRSNIEAASRGALPEGAIERLREAFLEAMLDAGEQWAGLT